MGEKPNPLQAIPLGIGDFFSQFNYQTSFVIIGGNTRMLIDCPDPLRKILYEGTSKTAFPTDVFDFDDILLTHLHGDHSNGLEGLGFYRKLNPKSPGRPRIHSMAETLVDLWERKLRAGMGRSYMPSLDIDSTNSVEDYFELCKIEPGKPYMIGDLEVEIRRSRHTVPCFGCKIRYGGRSLGYSSDTDFEQAHIDFLSDCDLIFHEANLGIHTDVQQLCALPEELLAKMRLTHLSDDMDVSSSAIETAKTGRLYVV